MGQLAAEYKTLHWKPSSYCIAVDEDMTIGYRHQVVALRVDRAPHSAAVGAKQYAVMGDPANRPVADRMNHKTNRMELRIVATAETRIGLKSIVC